MRYFNEFKIGDSPILAPDSNVEMTLTDLDSGSAGRDESGIMHRIRVRRRVKTWAFQYFALTREEFCYMEDLHLYLSGSGWHLEDLQSLLLQYRPYL